MSKLELKTKTLRTDTGAREYCVMITPLFILLTVLFLMPAPGSAQSNSDINSILRGGPVSRTQPALAPQKTEPPPKQEAAPAPKAEPGSAKVLKSSELRVAGTQSTVFIFVETDEKSFRTGTGFFISPTEVFTNSHVVENASDLIVVTHDRQRYKAKILLNSGTNAGADFAIIKLDRPAASRPVSFATSYAALSNVHAFGFPGKVIMGDAQFQAMFKGDKLAMPTIVASSGSIQNVMQNRFRAEVITHSAQISQGNSGGPLFDSCARVVGINTYIDATTIVSNDPKGSRTELTVRDGYQYALSSKEMIAFMQSRGMAAKADGAGCD